MLDPVFNEADNLGTRYTTFNQVQGYWEYYELSQTKDPYLLYDFNEKSDALDALLDLPCFHMAKDSNNLICTETIIFGYYYNHESDKYQVLLAGIGLSQELWKKAILTFNKHKGVKKDDRKPLKVGTTPSNTHINLDNVKFKRTEMGTGSGYMITYHIYTASDADTAKAFLQKNPVYEKFLYIVIETPEGNYGRDINGIYREK